MGFTERGIVESEEPGFLRLSFFDELGVRHAFSTRKGGVSVPPYHSLNLGLSVGDNPAAVRENRRRYFTSSAWIRRASCASARCMGTMF